MRKVEGACLICGADLEYLDKEVQMQCVKCGNSFMSSARCRSGHYVCDGCHSRMGIEVIHRECLASRSKNPIAIMQRIMEEPVIYMHGPEHHVLVAAALLTAYKNCGGTLAGEGSFEAALEKAENRGKAVPGGVCGLWGSCGAGISAGIFYSVISGANPLTEESWSLSNQMTASCLAAISGVGGPRCCKRDSFLSALAAAAFVKEHLNIELEMPDQIHCGFYAENKQCRGVQCPFFGG